MYEATFSDSTLQDQLQMQQKVKLPT